MESLQKAVAKELLKRQQQVDLGSPLIAAPSSAPKDEPRLETPQHAEAAALTEEPTSTVTEATGPSEDIPKPSLPTLKKEQTDEYESSGSPEAEPWFPDKQTLLTAIERARPKSKRKTLDGASEKLDIEVSGVQAEQQEKEQQASETPSSEPSNQPTTPRSELPDAFQLLLQSSPEQFPKQSEESDKERSTPHPFGRQRKKYPPESADESTSQESSSNTDSNIERRSLRGWFTPGRETDPRTQIPLDTETSEPKEEQ